MDPFAVFGLAPAIDIDSKDLEARYIELSRASHPDHHAGGDAQDRVAVLGRSAAVNDAYRALRDPWRRAEAMLELRAPGVLDATKNLAPAILAEALELAEEVAEVARSSAAADALRARLTAAVDADWQAVGAAITAADWDAAARRFHQARYHRKALVDLRR